MRSTNDNLRACLALAAPALIWCLAAGVLPGPLGFLALVLAGGMAAFFVFVVAVLILPESRVARISPVQREITYVLVATTMLGLIL